MLRLNKLTDYSVEILCLMTKTSATVYSAADLASLSGLKLPTVSKILKVLSRGGLVTSQRGAVGGYSLASSAETISIAEIINVMEGKLAMTQCSLEPGLCQHEKDCSVSSNWQTLNKAILRALEAVSLADMSNELITEPAIDLKLTTRSLNNSSSET